MQIQADFCYSNLQIHHLHEQELEQDESFEWMFPRCRLTPKMLISIPGFKVDWTLLDISPSTCLGPLAKPVQVHKLLLLLLFPSPESARLRFCPSELPADVLKHQHPAALPALVQPAHISHSGLVVQRAPFSSASPSSSCSYIPHASQRHWLNSPSYKYPLTLLILIRKFWVFPLAKSCISSTPPIYCQLPFPDVTFFSPSILSLFSYLPCVN